MLSAAKSSVSGQSVPPRLRLQAGIYYSLENPDTSLSQMSQIWPFSAVSLRTLQAWAAEDCWVQKRKDAHKVWLDRVQKELGDAIVQNRRRQLETLEDMQTEVLKKLRSHTLEARSFESMVNALVRLSTHMETLRTSVLASLPKVPENPRPLFKASFSDDEKRIVMNFINRAPGGDL